MLPILRSLVVRIGRVPAGVPSLAHKAECDKIP